MAPSIPYIYSWDVVSVPLDEAEIQAFQSYARVCSGNYFNLMVHAKHQFMFLTHPRPQPPTIIPTHPHFFQSNRSILLSSSELFGNGSSVLQVSFPDPIIPRKFMGQMMPQVITYAKNLVENYCPSSGLRYECGNFRLFKLVLNVVVEKPYDESPNKNVKLEKGGTQEMCSICLVEFGEGVEVAITPCTHKYHRECIAMWLDANYTCPLCRCPTKLDQLATGAYIE